MSIRKKIPLDVSLCMRFLHQENELPICVIRKRCPGYSTSSVYRHCKKDISNKETDRRKTHKERGKSLAVRDERGLICKLYELRERKESFIALRLQLETGLTNCSIKTIHRTQKRQGFSYLFPDSKEGTYDTIRFKASC